MYIIFTSNETLVELARENGDKCLTAPDNAQDIYFPNEESIDGAISTFLTALGFKAHYKGFDYLKLIINRALLFPGYENLPITRKIYPQCAELLNTSPSAIERCIRNSIMLSFNACRNDEYYTKVFGKLKKCPTNQQFVKTVTMYFKENIL